MRVASDRYCVVVFHEDGASQSLNIKVRTEEVLKGQHQIWMSSVDARR
jgi:hypothetical protein